MFDCSSYMSSYIFLLHVRHTFPFQVEERGGCCVPVQCDHTNDEDIRKLFDKINSEQNGRLDLLVNNAFSAINVRLTIFLH